MKRGGGYQRDSPDNHQYDTDVSTQYYGRGDGSFVDSRNNNSNVWAQTPTKNKYGGPGNRASQPQQRNRQPMQKGG